MTEWRVFRVKVRSNLEKLEETEGGRAVGKL